MPNSATRASEPSASQIINACAAAADELAATRRLTSALERENAALRDRLATASQAETLLKELNETRHREAEALRTALAAKNETIAAKDAVIAKQDELITQLKKSKSSPWKRLGDILIGVAISAVLK
ncbi:MAG: hypothetical protein AB7F88_01665 [Pyrinomonadaceae bacterium]